MKRRRATSNTTLLLAILFLSFLSVAPVRAFAPPNPRTLQSRSSSLQRLLDKDNNAPDIGALLNEKIKENAELQKAVESSLDTATNSWAFSYADLSPDDPSTLPGQAFLLTNLSYLAAGILIAFQGDYWFGFITDVAAVCSFNYHYTQLLKAGTAKQEAVQVALLLDYAAAAISILTGLWYVASADTVPIFALQVSVISLLFLGLSWVYEYGRPYMVWHSLWHLASGYAGYLIGSSHTDSMMS